MIGGWARAVGAQVNFVFAFPMHVGIEGRE